MTVKSYLSHAVAKPLFAGITASALDVALLKTTDYKKAAFFGASVGAGIFAVSWVEPLIQKASPTHTPISSTLVKGLEGRIVEVICGSGSAWAFNKYVVKNDYTSHDMMMRLGVIVAADLVGETVCEFLIII